MPEFPLSPTPLWRQLTCAEVPPQRSLVTPWLRLGYPFVTFPVSNICAFLILFFSFIPFSLLGLIDTVPRFLKIQPNHWLSRKRNCRNSLSDSVTMNSWPWALSRYWLQKHLHTVSMEKGVPTTLPPVKLQSQPLPFLIIGWAPCRVASVSHYLLGPQWVTLRVLRVQLSNNERESWSCLFHGVLVRTQ